MTTEHTHIKPPKTLKEATALCHVLQDQNDKLTFVATSLRSQLDLIEPIRGRAALRIFFVGIVLGGLAVSFAWVAFA